MTKLILIAFYFMFYQNINSIGMFTTSQISQLINYHFNDFEGAHLYFCTAKVAKSVLKNISKGNNVFNIKSLDHSTKKKNIEINFRQPQVQGIFLDLTCNDGVGFLNQCSNMFNSSHRWLLWSDNYKKTIELLMPMRVLADSDITLAIHEEYRVILADIYRIHASQPFRITNITHWTDNEFIHLDTPPARENFEGIELPMTEIKFNQSNLIQPLLDRSYEYGIDGICRYGLAIFLHLSEMCNYTYSFMLNNEWGVQLANGSWNGMIGQIQRRQTEMGLAPYKYVVEVTKAIDYVSSINTIRPCFTFLQTKMFGTKKALIRPLDYSVWGCLFVVTIAAILVFRLVAFYEGNTAQNDNLSGSIIIVIASFTLQGLPDSYEKASTRLIYLSLLIISFFAFTYYNTAILNGLLLQTPYAVHNIEQLLENDMDFGLLDRPLLRDALRKNDTLTKEVLKKLKLNESSDNVYSSIVEGVTRIKKGQFALFTKDEDIYAELLNQLSDAEVCILSEVEVTNPYHVGALSTDNSPYKEVFNRKFTLMKERGVIDRQQKYWKELRPECHWRQDPLVIGTGPLAVAFLVLIVGIAAAPVVLLVEMIIYNISSNKSIVPVKPFEKIQ